MVALTHLMIKSGLFEEIAFSMKLNLAAQRFPIMLSL